MRAETMRRRRNRNRNRSPESVQHCDADGADANAVLLEVESDLLASSGVEFAQKLAAISEGIVVMLGEAFFDECCGIVRSETSKDRPAVRGAMQGKSFADAGKGYQPLLTRNLIDEDGGAA